jgi:hypothetical protein
LLVVCVLRESAYGDDGGKLEEGVVIVSAMGVPGTPVVVWVTIQVMAQESGPLPVHDLKIRCTFSTQLKHTNARE